ncbi:MAG TPA: carboxypeptidase regulatory-like domain-containing protein [Chryseolinea sp.]
MKNLMVTGLLASLLIILPGYQIIKTTLNLTVRDEVGNTVEGATVQLFEKEEDYTAEKNVAAEGVTDAKGVLKVKDLKSMSYFVIVRKDDKDNSGGGERTGKLEEKRINKVTIVIQ